MIFLSAQPDEIYFLWQLQLQLANFHSSGIPAEQIHVLIGYRPKRGLHPAFRRLAEESRKACFFFYEDTRIRPAYLSSIRPHLIAKHYAAHPEMAEETICYHDSDILFHHQPDWPILLADDVWYASDTRSYLDTTYITRCIGEAGFREMCRILSISPDVVRANDREAGGAQYVLKNCPLAFWQKVEKDCESLYRYLAGQAGENRLDTPRSPEQTILYWCTDMWVVWWNALLLGKTWRISRLLDFCWPKDALGVWEIKPILHYAGKIEAEEADFYFSKKKYREYTPFYDDFSSVRPDSCSAAVAGQIAACRKQLDQERAVLSDTSVLLLKPEGVSPLQVENYVRYLAKHLAIRIETAAPGEEAARKALEINTPFLYICQADSLAPIPQLLASAEQLRQKKTAAVIPYDGTLCTLDPLSVYLFGKMLDTDLFGENTGKYLTTYSRETEVEAFLLNRETAGAHLDRLLSDRVSSLFPVGDCFNKWKEAGLAVETIDGAIYNFNREKLKRA